MILRASARFFSTSGPYTGRVCSTSGGIPHIPSGGGSMLPQIRIVEGWSGWVDQHGSRHIAGVDLAQRPRRLRLEILERRDVHTQRDHVELAGEKGQVTGCRFAMIVYSMPSR